MTKTTRLVVSISGHGFGHIAQTAPVLNILHQLYPELRITVRSSASAKQLCSRIHAPFTHLQSSGDTGMLMSSPLNVDIEKSRAAYQKFHADWDEQVSKEAQLLQELEADMVFSNAGYLPLAGAQRAGIPNAALCSLNWADIYRHYCGDGIITTQIQSCYARADAFLRATPGMAMHDLANLIPVAPIAEIGINRRDELNRLLKLPEQEKLVLVSMGGIASRLPVENWMKTEGVRYLVQSSWMTCPESGRNIEHPQVIVFDSLPMSFSDLLASSDVLLCKPGYGSFVEAACCGVPVLYTGRPDWPESPALIEWLKKHGSSLEVTPDELEQGIFAEKLEQLLCTPQPEAVIPTGAEEAAHYIAGRLDKTAASNY